MQILGYSSPADFARSLWGSLKHYKMHTVLPLAFSFALLMQVPLIEQWIWKPAWTLVLLTGVLLLDFILAVTSAKVIKGESFKTDKATKFVVSVLAYWITLALAYNMEPLVTAFNIGGDELFAYFGKAYFFFILFLNVASAMRHMSDLGYLPKAVAAFFIKYIDTHKGRLLAPKQDDKGEPTNDKEVRHE